MATVGASARWMRAFTVAVLFVFVASVLPVGAAPGDNGKGEQRPGKPTVRAAARHDTSAPLRTIKAKPAKKLAPGRAEEHQKFRKLPKAQGKGRFGPSATLDAASQAHQRKVDARTGEAATAAGSGQASPAAAPAPAMPEPTVNFEGIASSDNPFGVLPPDTNGDVGPNHYMQWVNLSLAVWDRAGTLLYGPVPGNTLFSGFGGICEDTNDGDPIVLYDETADRWLASQFALFGPDGFHQCIAISQSGDPTGAWHRYDFLISATKLNDYPKFGIWPDAYYMSINQFDAGTFGWAGAGAVAFEREQMLQGLPAQMVYFDLFEVNPLFGGQLPADRDGVNGPPAGGPGIFLEADDDAFGFATDRLSLWEFHVDWANPASSTFGIGGQPNLTLDTMPFEMELCGFSRSCIPQPGTPQGLDAISDRLMNRLQYRNLGDRQTLVTNHTVDVDGTDHAGLRWYILENTGSGWGIAQQGDHAPDAAHRWMGSAALDASGNLALGYSVSSAEVFPSIRTGGRLILDPTGTTPQPEGEIIAGGGSQTHPAARWGDYSMLASDPTDECTFWYTQEYLTETSEASWHTRIAAFRYPSCTTGPRGTVQGTVTSSDPAGQPIAGALVEVGNSSTVTDAAGRYAIIVPEGIHDVAASAYGFRKETVTGVAVADGAVVTLDFALDPLPQVVVSGSVTDAAHGWPLYARIDVGGAPIGPVFTNPETGGYSVTLFQETAYSFKVTGLVGTYLSQTQVVQAATPTATFNFTLIVDPTRCITPGYRVDIAGLSESFPTPSRPAGWLILDNIGGSGTWRFDDPAGRGNLTGGDGPFVMIDSDLLGPQAFQDTELWTPRVDLTGVANPSVIFRTDYFHFDGNDADIGPEVADVDVSIDNGGTWTNVWHEVTSRRGPRLVTVPVPTAAGEPNVRVRFHYYNANFEWWWQVDDVVVGTRDCTPIAGGGLLFGQVTDANTGAPLDGATVASTDAPADTTTSFSTPADPAAGDGLYVLFSSLTGGHPFTASKTNYADDTDSVDVAAGALTRHDFSLAAGQLSAAPSPIEVVLGMGETATRPLTLTNSGGADATFTVRERDAGRQILLPGGAPLRVVKGNFRPHTLMAGKAGAGGTRKVVHPPLAPPWTGIADYPIPIEGNAADTLDGKVYSVAGFSFDTGFFGGGFVYDPSANSWSPIANLSIAREKPTAAFIDGRLYLVGGWSGPTATPSPVLEIYDPASDTWSTGAESPAAFAASAAVALDGKLYVIGGCTELACGTDVVTVYDPASDSWSFAASYPERTSWASCGPIDGLIYCAGGVNDAELSSAWVYDPAADSWSPVASLPITLWGSGYVAANGLLLVSGGVTDNFSTITNVGFAYDPGTDTWLPIPNSNNTAFRGGSACGFYKIGGFGELDLLSTAELLPGFDECGGSADVPWLSADPVEGTVAANGGTAGITVTFDANVPEVDQPGTYFGQLTFKENTPYTTAPVDVIMHIGAPAGWGKVAGTVAGLARCDAVGGPLAGATVFVDGSGTDFTLKTDPSGAFGVWMPSVNGPVTITVSMAGYVGAVRSGVAIPGDGTTVTEDFTLRLDTPCASVSPSSIELTVGVDETAGTTLTLGNTAAAGYDFVIAETPFDLGPAAPALPASRTFKAPAPIGPLSIRSLNRPESPTGAAPTPQLPPWLGAAPLPNGAVRYAHAQCDGDPNHFYAISGVNGFFEVSTSTLRFDATTNAWTELAPIPQGSESPTGVCYAGRIYVLGGGGTDMNWVYDIATNTWATGAPLPRTLVGGAAAGWAGRIYLAGGAAFFDPSGTTDEVDIYDIASDTWIGTASPMAHGTSFPGYAQAGQYLYVAGGWDQTGGFEANVAASQRYDLVTGTWASGPDLGTPRADLALAATDTALYAIGGDTSGGSIFEASAVVERLETGGWPTGSWGAFAPLSMPLTANSAGFCTEAFSGGEVWSVGGADTITFTITGFNLFTGTPGEACPSIRADVPWLSVDPTAGSVAADGSVGVGIAVDAAGLAPGLYTATLLVSTTDPAAPEIPVSVRLTVAEAPGASILLSVKSAGAVGGVAVANEDIVSITGTVGTIWFDGSDVGLGSLAIDAFATLDDGSLLLSFTAPGTIAGIAVDDSDIVQFVPTELGANTSGTFSLWFDGSDVGLTSSDEDVDAIEVADGLLFVSTEGKVKVPGIGSMLDDSDILRFAPSSLGRTTAGAWAWHADMSDVGLSTDGEDLDALAIAVGDYHVSTVGALSVPGLTAQDDDVAGVTLGATGSTTAGTWNPALYLDGATLGIDGNDIAAIELP